MVLRLSWPSLIGLILRIHLQFRKLRIVDVPVFGGAVFLSHFSYMSIVGGWLIRTEWDQRDKRFRVLSQIELIHARLKGGTEHHPNPLRSRGFYSPHPRQETRAPRPPNPRLSPQSHCHQAQHPAPQTHDTHQAKISQIVSKVFEIGF